MRIREENKGEKKNIYSFDFACFLIIKLTNYVWFECKNLNLEITKMNIID